MPRKKKEEEYYDDEEEEYEEEDEEYYDDEEEDELTLDDINKGLDTLSKGLDVYAKLKKLNTPPQPPPPRPLSNNEAKWIGQDMIRKQKIDDEKKTEKIEEDNKKHKKWKIETIIKIAVPIIVALITVGFFVLKH